MKSTLFFVLLAVVALLAWRTTPPDTNAPAQLDPSTPATQGDLYNLSPFLVEIGMAILNTATAASFRELAIQASFGEAFQHTPNVS